MNLNNTNCVVTGAARGIGRAIAEVLLAAGARVVLSDVNAAALSATVKELNTSQAVGVAADVTSSARIAALAEEAQRHFGPIEVWINNAGLARHRAVIDYSEEEIDLMLAVNLKGTILGSQHALRAMIPGRRGHIINIISTASLRGIPTETVYCATKWGVRGFTQGLREEAAPLGIRVTALLPGGVDTLFWNEATHDRQVPVAKFLTARQVADVVQNLILMEDNVVPQELVLRALLDCDFSSE